MLADRYAAEDAPGQLVDFAFHLPVYVVGSLLGIPEAMLGQLALWIGDFVSVIANGIGLLTQAYQATAGLIGNPLLARASRAEARSAVIGNPSYFVHYRPSTSARVPLLMKREAGR